MSGWIYVMSNPAMPGLIKIGMSSKEPKQYRVKELSEATGVPSPFEVEYQALVGDEEQAEKQLHLEFSSYRYRKEFFKDLDIAKVIVATQQNFNVLHEDIFFKTAQEIEAERLNTANLRALERQEEERLEAEKAKQRQET